MNDDRAAEAMMSEAVPARRFVVFDPSLRGVGGHHYDYNLHVLRAAAEAGCEPVLICHRRFRDQGQLPRELRILPVFDHRGYNAWTIFFGRHPAFATGVLKRIFARLRHWRYRRAIARQSRAFVALCRETLSALDLRQGDIVFLPNISELDLADLASYLAAEPSTRNADWHVQIHLDLFAGREPEWDAQTQRLEWLRPFMAEAMRRVEHHRVHFYNTTDSLVRQYNRLGLATFEELPYPINPAFYSHPGERGPSPGPLRITCAGGARTEKGLSSLDRVVEGLWSGCLDCGRAQLLVQSKRWPFSQRPKHPVSWPGGTSRRTLLPSQACSDPVVLVRHPLDIDAYQQFVLGADLGLFLYDSRAYYSRRAGVLGEMLAAGIPVLVPAGCWLAEQVDEPNYQHAMRVLAQHRGGGTLPTTSQQWKVDAGLTVSAPHELQVPFDLPTAAGLLAFEFEWSLPALHGQFLKLCVECLDAGGKPIGRTTSILGQRRAGAHQAVLLRVANAACSVRLGLSNAYAPHTLRLHRPALHWVGCDASGPESIPLGSVGLVAADSGEVARLLREMVEHHAHYRQTAEDFAADWFARHDPRLTVSTLLQRSCGPAGR